MRRLLKKIFKSVYELFWNCINDNDGWIPVEKRLPDPVDAQEYCCPEYNVTIRGATEATTLKYGPDGAWFDDNGNLYDVIAWRPLPKIYRP